MPGKAVLIGIPLVVILAGGGVFGAARLGFLQIPGVTPPKKKANAQLYGEAASKLYGEQKEEAGKSKKPVQAASQSPAPKTPRLTPKPTHREDPERGAEAVAEVWGSMENEKLIALMSDWNDADLARVLRVMEPRKTAELLALMEATRASRLSREMQRQASQVPLDEAS